MSNHTRGSQTSEIAKQTSAIVLFTVAISTHLWNRTEERWSGGRCRSIEGMYHLYLRVSGTERGEKWALVHFVDISGRTKRCSTGLSAKILSIKRVCEGSFCVSVSLSTPLQKKRGRDGLESSDRPPRALSRPLTVKKVLIGVLGRNL